MNVDVLDESGSDADVTRLAQLSRYVLRRLRLHPATELCLRLVDSDTIAELNVRWMGEQGPTDVLSFPMDELRPGGADSGQKSSDVAAMWSYDDSSVDGSGSGGESAGESGDDSPPYVGDIALCPEIAAQQAPAAGLEPVDEVDMLVVHGILHLLGFDHAESDEHAAMFGLQSRLLTEWRQVQDGVEVDT